MCGAVTGRRTHSVHGQPHHWPPQEYPLTIRVGVLGAGNWAGHAHIPGFKRDDRCQIVAIADPVADRARDFAARFDIPHALTSHAELIARTDIELVDVCTPSATHFDLAWAALE